MLRNYFITEVNLSVKQNKKERGYVSCNDIVAQKIKNASVTQILKKIIIVKKQTFLKFKFHTILKLSNIIRWN